jgi:hypothetical protein
LVWEAQNSVTIEAIRTSGALPEDFGLITEASLAVL